MSDHADTIRENEALRIRSFLWRLRGGAIVHDDEIERAIERLDNLVKNYAAFAARCDALENALRDTLQEIDELGNAYTRLRKRYEPPYALYASWSRPAARAALAPAGERQET
jgi:hypothetical protein